MPLMLRNTYNHFRLNVVMLSVVAPEKMTLFSLETTGAEHVKKTQQNVVTPRIRLSDICAKRHLCEVARERRERERDMREETERGREREKER